MPRWAMLIDLRQCIGCKVCEIICRHSNGITPHSRRTIYDIGISEENYKIRISLPLHCMHCRTPYCYEVCPTGATVIKPNGIVDINHDTCIGCGYCIVACPYNVRQLNHGDSNKNLFDDMPVEHIESSTDKTGVCYKCDFCEKKVGEGISSGYIPGIDPDATPDCIITCSAGALQFGDLDDPISKISQLIENNSVQILHADAGTEPSVYYILPEGWYFSNGEQNK